MSDKLTGARMLKVYRANLINMPMETRETFDSQKRLTLQERVELLEHQIMHLTLAMQQRDGTATTDITKLENKPS